MTPNIRNAVVEATQKSKVYIYDGLFEGRCGANIFNIVKYNNSLQTVTQYVEGTDGQVTEHTAKMRTDETNGLEVLSMVNKTDVQGNVVYENGKPVKVPVSTENIRVRGGTFRCYYEGIMVGLNKDSKEGANDHNSDQMTVFPGSSGGVSLGVESYNEDLIKDGRIQLVDSYGDGALVLMDDNKDAGDKSIFHYRLFCTDEERVITAIFLFIQMNPEAIQPIHSRSKQDTADRTQQAMMMYPSSGRILMKMTEVCSLLTRNSSHIR